MALMKARRRKTTFYLDADVLTAAKVLAAATDRSESQVVEEALRNYLKQGQAAVARQQLAALLDRLAERADLSDEEALGLAYDELRASRSEAG
jgi:hypothetical protein